MTRYRKTMAEAWNESILIESGLMGTIKPDQLDNIKKVWAKKSMKDVTPGVRAMLAKLDMPTKVAVKHANINVLSKLVLDEKELEEQTELDEGRMKDIFTADQEGKSAEEIAKRLKISVKTVKDILGVKEQVAIDEGGVKSALMDIEDDATRMDLNKFIRKHYGTMGLTAQELKKMFYKVNNEETELTEIANFTASMINVLKKEYEPLRGKKITAARAKQLMNILDKLNDKNLEILSKQNIPFVSGGSASKLAVRKMKFKVTTINPFKEEAESIDEKIDPFMLSYSDRYNKHAGFEGAKTLQDLQNKAANLRKRGFKIDKMGRYNPPVKEDIQNEACWVGYKQVGMKDKGGKQVPNCVPEDKELEEHIEHIENIEEQLLDEMAALKKKSDKSGIAYSILKKVFDRGMAAWKGGHRPGASQHQWAYARVNSFITKGSGTWGGADKDLAKQARGQKEDLDAVPQDRDVKKKDGTQPKKYYKGLSKDVKDSRASHFKNNDSNKEAPGDKDAKTKPSIHTQKYKKMYGEGARELVLKFLKQKMQTSKEKITEAKWEIEGTLSYKGIGSYDNFHMVIDAANKKAAEDKAYEELDKARARKKIGPGGGGRVEDADVQEVNQTNDKLQAPTTFKGGN